METGEKNKMMDKAPAAKEADAPVVNEYFFPSRGITIKATSLEEAEAALAKQDVKSNN